MSRKLHAWARISPCATATKRARCVEQLEATGFDFDFKRIAGLTNRRSRWARNYFCWMTLVWEQIPARERSAGLGDWQPIAATAGRSRAAGGRGVKRGLRFGIWIEPEMVNPKSELFERHPDWSSPAERELELQRTSSCSI